MSNLHAGLILLFALAVFSCEKENAVPVEEGVNTTLDFRKKKDVVTLCHYDDEAQLWKILEVNDNALVAHLDHGDVQLDDLDGDGFVPDNECDFGPQGDCDDDDASLNPETVWYLDADRDGYFGSSIMQCSSPGPGYTRTASPEMDCDDDDPAVNPGAEEDCDTPYDDNCDGIVNEDCCADVNTYPTIENNGLIWTAQNLDIPIDGSLCYDNDPAFCTSNGRLYPPAAGQAACKQLGDCWRLPTADEWVALANSYGGVGYNKESTTIAALETGGESGFDALRTGGFFNGSFTSYDELSLYLVEESLSSQLFFAINSPFYPGPYIGLANSNAQAASCRCVRDAD